METKGLVVGVYRSPLGDFTNKGPSSKFDHFVLVDVMISAPFEPQDDRPELHVFRSNYGGKEYIYAVPVSVQGEQTMFGGNFVYCSDSRLSKISLYPIPIHDRVENPRRLTTSVSHDKVSLI